MADEVLVIKDDLSGTQVNITEEATFLTIVNPEPDIVTISGQEETGTVTIGDVPTPEEHTVIIVEERIDIVTVGEQGPPGIKGEKGDTGEAGRNSLLFNEFSFVMGKTKPVLFLPERPIPESVGVFINGLRILKSSYVLTDKVVSLNPQLVYEGDTVTVSYYY